MVPRRARSDADKAARHRAILDAAGALFDEVELEAFTMDAVAASLELAKGTLYRYVPTREALLLELLVAELDAWFDEVDAGLSSLATVAPIADAGGDARRPREVDEAVTDLLAGSVLARHRLVRLTAVLPTLLERNIPYGTAHAFKTFLLERTLATGAALEAARPTGDPTDGVRLLVHLQAAVVGLHSHAHPAPVVREVLADPVLAPLQLDFATELRHVVGALVAAAPSPPTPSPTPSPSDSSPRPSPTHPTPTPSAPTRRRSPRSPR